MTAHRCPTGWHPVPQYGCRAKHECTCPGCVAAYRAHWRAKQQRLHGYTDRGLDDAATTRAQLAMLRENGWTVAGLARAAGCTRQTIRWTLAEERRVSARIRDAVDRLWRSELVARREARLERLTSTGGRSL